MLTTLVYARRPYRYIPLLDLVSILYTKGK